MSDGIYWVSFGNGELTEAESRLIKTFGAPVIELAYGDPGHLSRKTCSINEIDESYSAAFDSLDEARAYESTIVTQVREKMSALMKQVDDFTSAEELDI